MINSNKSNALNELLQIAGILPNDNSIEFYAGDHKTKSVLWFQNGTSRYFTDIPLEYYQLLEKAMLNDQKAYQFLSSATDIQHKKVELYTYYMYGDLDSTPDIKNGVLSSSENFRDTRDCPSQLWDSKNITIGAHILTPRQLLIIDMIHDDLQDKMIAYSLGITLSTLDSHKRKLYSALGIDNKTALISMAYKYKVIK